MSERNNEKESLREGRWCLKYGNWVRDISKDSYFDGTGCPECIDCPYEAWNVTDRGLPIEGMPVIFYFNDKMNMTEYIKPCTHGNLFLKHPYNPLSNENGWMRLVDEWWLVETECDCKSAQGE